MSRLLNVYSASYLADAGMQHMKFVVTRDAPLFAHKARLMSGATFVCGAATMNKIVRTDVDTSSKGLDTVLSQQCHFVVGGGRREVSYRHTVELLDHAGLSPEHRGLFQVMDDDEDGDSVDEEDDEHEHEHEHDDDEDGDSVESEHREEGFVSDDSDE